MAVPIGAITGAAGALTAGIGSFLGTPKKVKVPEFPQVLPRDVEAQGMKDVAVGLPEAEKLAGRASAFTAEQLRKMSDFALPGTRKVAEGAILDLLSGRLPGAVEQSLVSSATAQALRRGFGGTGFQGTATMLALRGKAMEGMQAGFGMMQQYLAPYQQAMVSPMSFFLNPQQRLATAMWQAENNYQRALLKAQIKAQPSQDAMRWSNLLMTSGSMMAGASAGGAFSGMAANQAPLNLSMSDYGWPTNNYMDQSNWLKQGGFGM